MNICTVLHPYYKLAYIKLSWGGEKEQVAEIKAGNLKAKNWHDEARQLIERTVRRMVIVTRDSTNYLIKQMAEYYNNRPSMAPIVPTANASSATSTSAHVLSEFDKHHETLLSEDLEEGWASELCRYTSTMQRDVKKDTDIVEWWQVRTVSWLYPSSANPNSVEPCPAVSYTRAYCT